MPRLLGNLTANALRNVWAHTVVFCGHFPGDAQTFTEDQIEHHVLPDLPSNRYAEFAPPGTGDLRPVRTAVRHRGSGSAVRVDVGVDAAPRAAVGVPLQASWALA